MNRRLAAVFTLAAAACLTASCSILSPEPGTLDTNNGPTFTGPQDRENHPNNKQEKAPSRRSASTTPCSHD